MENVKPEQERAESTFPWLVFKLEEIEYAVSSEDVTSIMIMPDKISEMPDMPYCMRGVFDLRGEMVPLLDLRRVFGLRSLEDEMNEFRSVIEEGKEDHKEWIAELERCVNTGDKFTLATDPHKCAFGAWCDSFTNQSHAINHQLKKIDAPHHQLHNMAVEIYNAPEERRGAMIQEIHSKLMPQIMSLLDSTLAAYEGNLREMVIVIEEKGRQIGITVDEVVAVEQLSALCDHSDMEQFHETRFVMGVSHRRNSEEMILRLDKLALFALLGGVDFSQMF